MLNCIKDRHVIMSALSIVSAGDRFNTVTPYETLRRIRVCVTMNQ